MREILDQQSQFDVFFGGGVDDTYGLTRVACRTLLACSILLASESPSPGGETSWSARRGLCLIVLLFCCVEEVRFLPLCHLELWGLSWNHIIFLSIGGTHRPMLLLRSIGCKDDTLLKLHLKMRTLSP
jgi:hypothetical protein